jgi:hypothetical protein
MKTNRVMLSFDKTEHARLIAYAENQKTKEKLKIYFVNDYNQKTPNIVCETPRQQLKDEEEFCLNEFGLTPDEWDDLVDATLSEESTSSYHRRYQLAIRYLRKKLNENSKKQLDFRGTDFKLRLYYDSTPPPEGEPMPAWITTAIANTFSGKSYFLNSFLMSDENKNPRKVYMFTGVPTDDPSFKPLREKLNKNETDLKYTKFNLNDLSDDNPINDHLDLGDFEEGRCVLLFDDVSSVSKKNPYREPVLELLNTGLERIRHTKNVICASNHLRSDYSRTRKLNNSSRVIVLFPRSNAKMVMDMLTKELNFHVVKARQLLQTLIACGRACLFHRHHPMFILTEKMIMLV